MRIAQLDAGRDQLQDAGEVLEQAWRDTRDHWRDANSRNLEENHLEPLLNEVVKMIAAIQNLDDVLKQAARECNPR